MPRSRQTRRFRPTQSRVRVIAGEWRGRWIDFPVIDGLRPTGDRMRETLFNWLQPVLSNARCVDLYAGSGALAIEAVSRGAEHAILIDAHPAVVRNLELQVARLEPDRFTIRCADALDVISGLVELQGVNSIDLAFVDPPFDTQQQVQALERLAQSGILADNAQVYVEAPVESALESGLPAGFLVHRSKVQAQVQCLLLQWTEIRESLNCDSAEPGSEKTEESE